MQDIVTAMVDFAGNGDQVPGYLARPSKEGTFPGVVVIQEWWGLDGHIRDITERFARAGYVAIAPDLYRGKVANEPDEARKLVMELDQHRAVVDIQGAINYLRNLLFVEPKQIGVIGFCMGGGLSLMMASKGQHVGAAVVFYGGRNALDDDTANAVTAPVLGIFGEADAGIPLDTVRSNEAKLKQHGKTAEFIIYPQAPHAFFNNERDAYRPEAAADAWQRTLNWFEKYLKA